MEKKKLGNLGLKILSLVLAVSLWFFVTYRGQSEMILDAPIEFKNVPKGLELLRRNVKSVSLNIRGHERMLKSLRPMDVRVVIDMTGAKNGDNDFYFDKADIVIPRTIKVLRMDPTYMRVVLDESVKKVLPVKVPIIGTVERGYSIKALSVSPQHVTVEGAKTEVHRIAVLRTEPLDVTGFDADISQNVRINTNGINIRTQTSEVTVKLLIRGIEK